MPNGIQMPVMDWSSPNLGEVDYILLMVGIDGLKKFNSWSFENDEDKKDPTKVWKKFVAEIHTAGK